MSAPAASWPSSVWAGNDAALLRWMIPFYTQEHGALFAPRILDCTYGHGAMWKGWPAGTPPVGIDLRSVAPGVIPMDNRALGFLDQSFDVLVYDPPHISEGGRSWMHEQYTESGTASVSALFAPFLAEARRVLVPGGLLFCKIADQVHRARAQWQHIDFYTAACAAGFTMCDLIVKVRKTALMGKWKTAHHARKFHSFWWICRTGGRC